MASSAFPPLSACEARTHASPTIAPPRPTGNPSGRKLTPPDKAVELSVHTRCVPGQGPKRAIGVPTHLSKDAVVTVQTVRPPCHPPAPVMTDTLRPVLAAAARADISAFFTSEANPAICQRAIAPLNAGAAKLAITPRMVTTTSSSTSVTPVCRRTALGSDTNPVVSVYTPVSSRPEESTWL